MRVAGAPSPRSSLSSSVNSPSNDRGEVLTETYELRSMLGDGGSATVYSAVHIASGKVYACKIASKRKRKWERLVHKFDHEWAMLQRCAHVNIMAAHDFFRGPTQIAIVAEHIGGGDIQQLLERHGALSEPAVCATILQLTAALAHVHSQVGRMLS